MVFSSESTLCSLFYHTINVTLECYKFSDYLGEELDKNAIKLLMSLLDKIEIDIGFAATTARDLYDAVISGEFTDDICVLPIVTNIKIPNKVPATFEDILHESYVDINEVNRRSSELCKAYTCVCVCYLDNVTAQSAMNCGLVLSDSFPMYLIVEMLFIHMISLHAILCRAFAKTHALSIYQCINSINCHYDAIYKLATLFEVDDIEQHHMIYQTILQGHKNASLRAYQRIAAVAA